MPDGGPEQFEYSGAKGFDWFDFQDVFIGGNVIHDNLLLQVMVD